MKTSPNLVLCFTQTLPTRHETRSPARLVTLVPSLLSVPFLSFSILYLFLFPLFPFLPFLLLCYLSPPLPSLISHLFISSLSPSLSCLLSLLLFLFRLIISFSLFILSSNPPFLFLSLLLISLFHPPSNHLSSFSLLYLLLIFFHLNYLSFPRFSYLQISNIYPPPSYLPSVYLLFTFYFTAFSFFNASFPLLRPIHSLSLSYYPHLTFLDLKFLTFFHQSISSTLFLPHLLCCLPYLPSMPLSFFSASLGPFSPFIPPSVTPSFHRSPYPVLHSSLSSLLFALLGRHMFARSPEEMEVNKLKFVRDFHTFIVSSNYNPHLRIIKKIIQQKTCVRVMF